MNQGQAGVTKSHILMHPTVSTPKELLVFTEEEVNETFSTKGQQYVG
jgi:hypothetical protein